MSGKILITGGRVQTAQGRVLRGQAPENASVPCPCCGKTYYVQLRTCCLQTGGDDIGSPYPNGLGPFYIPLNLLQANCGTESTGWLAFFPGKDGVAQFCMTYNLDRDPPIPAGSVPEGATIVTEEDTFTCYDTSICQNEEICPSCPACCHEVGIGWRCVEGIDPHPSNPTSFVCNLGRTYRITYDYRLTFEKREWQFCATSGFIRCDPLRTTMNVTETSGVMTFTKACPPDNVASCTGSVVQVFTSRVEEFGTRVPCEGDLVGGSVTENTTTTETTCEDWGASQIPLGGGPEDPDDFCEDTQVEEFRCGPENTGDVFKRVTTQWDFRRKCFEGSTFFQRTDKQWWKDQAVCPFASCPATAAVPCINEECYFEQTTTDASYTVEILGIIGCAGPWETYDINVANGYPGSAAGFFEGWYALGLGNAEGFL